MTTTTTKTTTASPILRQNPFTTYRDPKTGRWVVVTPPKWGRQSIINHSGATAEPAKFNPSKQAVHYKPDNIDIL